MSIVQRRSTSAARRTGAAVLAGCVCATALLVLLTGPTSMRTELAADKTVPHSKAALAVLVKIQRKKVAKPAKAAVKAVDTARSIAATAEAALEDLEGKRPSSVSTSSVKAAASKAAVKKAEDASLKEATLVSPSDSEVHTIMNTMMKADAAKKQDKEAKESKTDRMQDRILRAKSRLASLKMKKSNDFAQYEKEDEVVDDAKSKAQQAHDEYQEDMERERSYKQRVHHLQQKLANHLTGSHARTDLNSYYAHLNDEAIKTIPKKIRDADTMSSHQAAHYKHAMEQHHKALADSARRRKAEAMMDARETVSLKQFPLVNVWDTHPKQDVVDSAEKKLQALSKDVSRQILKAEVAATTKNQARSRR